MVSNSNKGLSYSGSIPVSKTVDRGSNPRGPATKRPKSFFGGFEYGVAKQCSVAEYVLWPSPDFLGFFVLCKFIVILETGRALVPGYSTWLKWKRDQKIGKPDQWEQTLLFGKKSKTPPTAGRRQARKSSEDRRPPKTLKAEILSRCFSLFILC